MSDSDSIMLKYFVLKPRGTDPYAAASRAAMIAYAEFIKDENQALASDLVLWVMSCEEDTE